MRAFLILLILVAIGYAGWSWYTGRNPASVPVVTKAEPVMGDAPPVTAQPPVNPPPPPPPAIPAEVKADFDQAEALWQQAVAAGQQPAQGIQAPHMGRLFSKVLRGIYNKPGQQALEKVLVEQRLTPIGFELFFSKSRFPTDETGLMAVHTVQPGESPDRIAKRYGMSMELLNRIRGKDANDSRLNAGDSLKVVKVGDKGGFLLHIDKSDFFIDSFIGGVFAKRYAISHGALQTPTPIGHTKLTDRVLDPSWTHPVTHKVYGPNDPENILGRVWMAFSADGIGQGGLGIHGYTGPNPQMRAMVSNGCIRLENDNALELYRTLSHPNRCKCDVEIVD